MSEKIYFQWQNEYLLHTIYPLREVKLRDFLRHYYEIDIWQALKDQPIETLSDEVAAYRAAKTEQVASLHTAYERELAYSPVDRWITMRMRLLQPIPELSRACGRDMKIFPVTSRSTTRSASSKST